MKIYYLFKCIIEWKVVFSKSDHFRGNCVFVESEFIKTVVSNFFYKDKWKCHLTQLFFNCLDLFRISFEVLKF